MVSDTIAHYSEELPEKGTKGIPDPQTPIITGSDVTPLPEGTFPAPELGIPSTISDDGRQLLGKSSSDEPSRIFSSAGTSGKEHGMSETPTEHVSVNKSLQTLIQSVRNESDTPPERTSENPTTQMPIDLNLFVHRSVFEAAINERDAEIRALKKILFETKLKLQDTEEQLKQSQELQADIIKNSEVAVADLRSDLEATRLQNLKDYSTEGEKAHTEKVLKDTLQFQPQGEEGELNLEMAREVELNLQTNKAEEVQPPVDEEEEFADNDAFDNDCLLIGKKIEDPAEAQRLLTRKLLRERRARERRLRAKDVETKQGKEWDEARDLMMKPELTENSGRDKLNSDKDVMNHIREIREKYNNIHEFFTIFDQEVTCVSVSAHKSGWRMFITFRMKGAMRLSSRMLHKLNLVELYVIYKSVVKGGKKTNDVLRDMIEDKIKEVGVEAYSNPPVVKYFKNQFLHNLTLTDECLDRSYLEFMKYIEARLRQKQNRTSEDLAAAELIYAFRLNRAMMTSPTYLKKESRYYFDTVYVIGDDGVQQPEVIADTEPCITRNEKGELMLCFTRGKKRKVANFNTFNKSSSETIRKILSRIKRSTNKQDKIALRPVMDILKNKIIDETEHDTDRVKGHPKRITAFLFARYVEIEFEKIKSINSMPYLERLHQIMKDPDPKNVLEAEARDLVQIRLEQKKRELAEGGAQGSSRRK